MKTNKIVTIVLLMATALLSLGGCKEDTSIDIPQTKVKSISATQAEIGTEITITGENINLISKLTFGTVDAVLSSNLASRDKYSLTVTVPTVEETSIVQVIATYNTVQKIVVCEEFEMYVPPVIPTVETITENEKEVEAGALIVLNGSNLNIIKSILVGTQEVAIRSKDKTSISFVAPAVEETQTVSVVLVYDNSTGTGLQLPAGELTIKVVVPSITGTVPTTIEQGKQLTVSGENLNLIDRILLGEREVTFTKTASSLTISIPADAVTGSTSLTAIYGNNKSLTISGGLIITAAPTINIHKWLNVALGCSTTNKSFLNATTGGTITNCDLPQHQADVDLAAVWNTGASQIRLYSPGNMSGIISQYKCESTTPVWSNFPILQTITTKFVVLSEGNTTHKAIIDKVKADELMELDDDFFTGITPSGSTVSDLAVGSIIYFKNPVKAKNGLLLIKEIKNETPVNNSTIIIDVFYQK